MVPLLLLVFLLIREGSGQIELQPKLNDYIGKQLNEFRSSVATGAAYKLGGNLPSTLSMFELNSISRYQMLAQLNSQNCTKGDLFPPTGKYSMNFYSTSSLPSSITSEDVADVAIGQWKLEPYIYGIGDDVIYTNAKLQDFANIIYYKTTEYGCHYQVCTDNIAKLPINVLACVFNNAPEKNEPLYIASTDGRVDGCNFDSDCQEYVPFSKCTATASASNSYTGLCYTTNVTTFITPSSIVTSTSTASMSTKVSPTIGFVTTAGESAAVPSTTVASTELKPETTEAASTTTESTTVSSEASSKATEETTATSNAATTTEATTVAATTTTATSATTTPPDPMTEALRLKVIDMHNYRRSRLAQGLVPNQSTGKNAPAGSNIYELKYDIDLEKDAQEYANTCPKTPSPVSSRSSQGENLGIIYDTSKSYYDIFVSGIQSFWKEIKEVGVNEAMMFNEALEYSTKPPTRFTQMAWATTYQVGCGINRCEQYGATVLVCRYYPRGNIVGDYIYNVGTTCADCSNGCTTEYLYKGLCFAPN